MIDKEMIDKNSGSESTSSAPLELDNDLRLHAQRLQLGQAELLTDALTLPFSNIENRLAQFVISSSNEESEQLRRSMKQYLGRLNSNPLIPLQFRMKVLNRFEQQLDLFDGDMTAAVLNSHKIAVEMVQKAARSNDSYYPILVDMLSNSIELALKLLQISLEKYQAPAIIATRQFFELARLGLGVAAALDHQHQIKVKRLHVAICKFELLRLLDFYGKTIEEQSQTWKELQFHIDCLQAYLCRSSEPHQTFNGSRFLVSNLNRPNDAAKVLTELPDQLDYDCILIPVDTLISRISLAVEHIQGLLSSKERQKDLYTEEAMLTTLVGGTAILNALKSGKRESNRRDVPETHISIEWNPGKALSLLDSDVDNRRPDNRTNQWLVINSNRKGACIERLSSNSLEGYVGCLIGLHWLPESELPRLAFIRWAKEVKSGEQRLGIEFLQGRLQLVKGMILAGGENMDLNRSWPVLITAAGKGFYTALFPDNRIYRNMTFALMKDNKRAHYRISRIVKKGPNYSLCDCVRAKVSGRPET